MEKQLTSTNYYAVIQSYPDYKYYDYLGKMSVYNSIVYEKSYVFETKTFKYRSFYDNIMVYVVRGDRHE